MRSWSWILPACLVACSADASDGLAVRVDHDAACAGRVRIVGSVMDTLRAGTVPVQSGLITPDCG